MLYCFGVSTKIIFNVSSPDLGIQHSVYQELLKRLCCLSLKNSGSDEWHVNQERMRTEISAAVQSGHYLANGFFTEPFIAIQRDMNSTHEKEYFDFIDGLGDDIQIIHIHVRSDVSKGQDRRTSLSYLYSKLLDHCKDDAAKAMFRASEWSIFESDELDDIFSFVRGILDIP